MGKLCESAERGERLESLSMYDCESKRTDKVGQIVSVLVMRSLKNKAPKQKEAGYGSTGLETGVCRKGE